MSLVEVEGLGIAVGGRAIVEDVSFSIAPGERLGLIGESGSGKSMTALALSGLLPRGAVASGTIRFGGANLPATDREMAALRAKRIGMVFQEPMTALNPLMRVGAQLAEALALAGQDDADIPALLAEVGLEPGHGNRFPHQLSGGQRQRVVIAMAVAKRPELIIADEPSSALDLITQRRVLDLIDDLSRRHNAALLLISHDLKVVAALCSRIAVMQDGRLVEAGPTSQVLAAPRHVYTHRLIEATRAGARVLARPVTGGTVLFEARAVSRSFVQGPFHARTRLRAVDAVSFSIAASDAVALVGPSGCGKTTLARIVAGLDRPTSGTLRLDDADYSARRALPRSARRDVSLVFQDPFSSFDPRLPVGRSVGQPLEGLMNLPPVERAPRVAEALAAVGLTPEMAERYPHQFSGGQRQRLAIARALVTQPRLVVLDEPVSALDMSVRGEVLTLLNRLRADYGLAYLLISHDLDMVRQIADRVLVMEAGRIVEEGRPAQIFAAPQHRLTRELVAARLPELTTIGR